MKRELLVESLLIKSDGKVFTDIIHDMNNVGICVVLYNKNDNTSEIIGSIYYKPEDENSDNIILDNVDCMNIKLWKKLMKRDGIL